jgi:[CysO sulfur-carrier protein]-S-L-cysteine hydrolase
VVIPRKLYDEIVDHARAEFPNECCGIVAAQDGVAVKVFKATNIYASPMRYEIAPLEILEIQDQIDAQGWSFDAIYHSHTRSAAKPSQTDINQAGLLSDTVFLIISLENPDEPDLRGFKIADGRDNEIGLSIE